jgi:hypothetical protein
MLLLEVYISNFTRARYYFLCVEFSDFYVNQSLAGQTILMFWLKHLPLAYLKKGDHSERWMVVEFCTFGIV